MASRHFALPLAIVTLLSAVLVRGSGGGDDSASSSRKAKAGSGAKAASVASNAGDDEDASDVLDVLAQSYGVDLAPHRLMQMAARAMAQLKDRSTAPEDFRRSLLFINDLVTLDLRESTAGSRQAARESATRLTNRTLSLGHEAIPEDAAGDVGRIAAFVDPYVAREHVSSNQPEDDADSDFAGVDKTALKRGVLARAIDRHDSSVRYLIASLPDPVDSYTGWQFDPMLDGIVQAISASDFILDRFYLPGSQPGASEDQEALRRQLHDAQPGLVVFKRQVGESSRPDDAPAACLPNRNRPGGMVTGTGSAQVPVWQDRLVLMIVHENPTAGVHQAALSHAINWAADWPSTPPCESILILGPTFSGTSDSMSRVLELARARRVSRGIRIVSGSATDPQNKATLERTANVTFHATVNPDSSLMATLMGHFRSLGWTTPIAILHEANTQYGRQMQKHLVKAMPDATRGDLIETQFPMNLSRLRTTADRKAADNDSGVDLQTTMRPLAMEDKEDAKDKIPQYFPGTANAYIALGLARMLETLGQAEVKSVAIMATDPRDKLYLAQQLALHRPDVSVLTAETDSLYLHPDYSAYMRGALVASTYPLYGALQHWTYGRWTFGEGPADAQREFANDSAQGVYNATLALIDYDQDPTSHTPYAPAVPNVPSPPPLLGYGLAGTGLREAMPAASLGRSRRPEDSPAPARLRGH